MNFEKFKSLYLKKTPQEIQNKVKSNPLLSVIVLTYQHVNYIDDCLKSILEQKTDFDFEIILGEDDSTDGTREICIKYAEENPDKIRLILHLSQNKIKINDELTGNFNAIYNFYLARGKYIAICEGDDYWGDPLKLQKQFHFMETNPSYSICYHDFRIINKQGNIINSNKAYSFKKNLDANELKHPVFHPASLTIFFRNKFKKLPVEISRVLTIDAFVYILLGHYGDGKFMKSIKPAFYRVHDNGIWSNRELDQKLLAKINTYKKISFFYLKKRKLKSSLFFQKKIFKLHLYLIYLYSKKVLVRD